MANLIMRSLTILLLLAIVFGCGDNPTLPPTEPKPPDAQIIQDSDNLTEIPEAIELDNCGNPETVTQTKTRSFSITIEGDAIIKAGWKGIVEGSIGAKYIQFKTNSVSHVMTAGAHTNMEFVLNWHDRKIAGRIFIENLLGNYTASIPISVDQLSAQDKGCGATLVVPPASIGREEYVDGDYQEEGMHACKKGFAIAGVHAGNNKYLCRRVLALGEEDNVMNINDSGLQKAGMHACPEGSYMRGLHVGNNILLCSYDKRHGGPKEVLKEFEDDGTQGQNMHICPRVSGQLTYLTGIHVDDNRFLCGVNYRNDVQQ